MFDLSDVAVLAITCLALVLTPGPNMIYCVSRTLTQGRAAGFASLAGVMAGFVVYLVGTSLGLTALLLALPLAFDAIKLAGAAYLLWLAWQALKPGGRSAFEVRDLPVDGPRKLFAMGFMTNLLNPKVAMFYLSFFPQFLHPERGHLLLQTLGLGAVQMGISAVMNSLIIVFAASIAHFLARSPGWLRAQRYVMGTVLAGLAVRLLMERRTA
jgi:threonine/homoserine/homoserine lactone efflux protein